MVTGKCFASHRAEKRQAFNVLRQVDWQVLTTELEWYLAGLWQQFNQGDNMTATQPFPL